PTALALSPLALHDALPICALDDGAAALAEEIGRRPLVADGYRRGAVAEGEGEVERARLPPERAGLDHATEAVGLARDGRGAELRSEEHTSELQSRFDLVCR